MANALVSGKTRQGSASHYLSKNLLLTTPFLPNATTCTSPTLKPPLTDRQKKKAQLYTAQSIFDVARQDGF
jgi:hypothetical protein